MKDPKDIDSEYEDFEPLLSKILSEHGEYGVAAAKVAIDWALYYWEDALEKPQIEIANMVSDDYTGGFEIEIVVDAKSDSYPAGMDYTYFLEVYQWENGINWQCQFTGEG